MNTDTTKCIHCRMCTDSCSFLSKYGIDIGDTDRLRELAFHCMLCGNCSRVCPEGIDGREVVMNLRRERVAAGDKTPDEKGYRMMLLEKKNYKFRNYRHGAAESVLFPGCNFPSVYPGTTSFLAKMLRERAGMGVVYDCCGKPVAELGLAEDEKRIVSEINARLEKAGVKEVVMVCPNCYYFLKDRLNARVVSIYEKLHEIGYEGRTAGGGRVFMPCPDRDSAEMLDQIERYFADKPYVRIEGIQCCGLGGSAGVKEPELASSCLDGLKGDDADRISSGANGDRAEASAVQVYCASCAGQISRNGAAEPVHILTEILGTNEKPDTGKSMVNRLLTRFK